jgi:hypothetical protein
VYQEKSGNPALGVGILANSLFCDFPASIFRYSSWLAFFIPRFDAASIHPLGSSLDRFSHRREIIRLISAMNATVGAKTAEQGLLKLKQQQPDAFDDLCLYSEVCMLLTR